MYQITGLTRRARVSWPQWMSVVDDWREEDDPGLRVTTLRGQANGAASLLHPIPEWFFGYDRHGNYEEVQQEREETLDLVAFHNIRVVIQRFILNMKKLVARRRHKRTHASILGAW